MEKAFVYQTGCIELVTVAAETCRLWEHTAEAGRAEFIRQSLCLLPLLYLKARLCPRKEEEAESIVEHFVTELDYNEVQSGVQSLMGSDDAYLDVMVEDFRYSDEPLTCFISENIADIYQEIKDLCAAYQTGSEEAMQDALLYCLEQFDLHWGQKALNALRALHVLSAVEGEEIDD